MELQLVRKEVERPPIRLAGNAQMAASETGVGGAKVKSVELDKKSVMDRRPKTLFALLAAACAWVSAALLLVVATGEIWIGVVVTALGPTIGIGWTKWQDRRRLDLLDPDAFPVKKSVYSYDSDGNLTQVQHQD